MVIARMTSKGRITVPKQVRERLGIEPGDGLEFMVVGDRLEVRPIYLRKFAEFRGLFPVAESLTFADERAQARIARGRLRSVDVSTDG
jgi:AbrB family looped-hinge helix DNA binding protein